MCGSAAESITDSCAHSIHRALVGNADISGQRRPRNRVDTVAVDCRLPIQSNRGIIQDDFGGETAHRSRDLGDSHQRAHINHLGTCEYQDRTSLPPYLGQPHFSARHSSPHDSASSQNASGRSGCRR